METHEKDSDFKDKRYIIVNRNLRQKFEHLEYNEDENTSFSSVCQEFMKRRINGETILLA